MNLQHHQNLWSILMDVIHRATNAREPRDLADYVVRRLAAQPECGAAGIWLVDRDKVGSVTLYGFEQPPSLAQIHRVVESGAPVTIEHLGEPRADGQQRSLAFLPLGTPTGRVGALVVQVPESMPVEDQQALEAIAAYTALALQSLLDQLGAPQAPPSNDRAWEFFLAHAAHEIKNPLASIKGYADLLLRRVSGDPADPYRKGLTIIAQQVARTTSLLEQLSELARAGSEQTRAELRAVDIASMLSQAAEQHQATTDAHELGVLGAETPIVTRCDEARIRQVVDIMLSNAIKFSQGGRIEIRLRRADAASQDIPGSAAIIEIHDHGIGVPPGEQERIFERFYRGSNVAGAYRGLGGSLFVAKAIVERHGGRMWLESSPEQGTSSFVALPIR